MAQPSIYSPCSLIDGEHRLSGCNHLVKSPAICGVNCVQSGSAYAPPIKQGNWLFNCPICTDTNIVRDILSEWNTLAEPLFPVWKISLQASRDAMIKNLNIRKEFWTLCQPGDVGYCTPVVEVPEHDPFALFFNMWYDWKTSRSRAAKQPCMDTSIPSQSIALPESSDATVDMKKLNAWMEEKMNEIAGG